MVQLAALLFYVFGWLTGASFVVHFVVCVLFISIDFWFVKNVSGRILVGLRWWNEVDEAGENIWRFESLPKEVLAAIIPYIEIGLLSESTPYN